MSKKRIFDPLIMFSFFGITFHQYFVNVVIRIFITLADQFGIHVGTQGLLNWMSWLVRQLSFMYEYQNERH